MSKAIAEIASGVGLVAVDLVFLGGNPILLQMGLSLITAGVGSLLTKQRQGIAGNTLNPIQPWNVVYGRTRVGGTTIYQQTGGQTDKYWHRVIVLACHPCQSVDAVIFDNKRVCLDTSGNSLSFGNSTAVIASQQTVNIASISRSNNVVTVVMTGAMPLPASTAAGPALMDADTVLVQNVSTDRTLNGLFQIQVLNSTSFTYICGGNPITITGQGQVMTQWPDYGDTVHLEVALGNQSPTSPPFPGLLSSGSSGSQGEWTSTDIVQGRTAVYLRMKYGGNTYQAGIPQIGFLIHGKNDIYDPRLGSFGSSGTTGYTENAALCIADFLCQQTWGFKCNYSTDVPTSQLIAAANICDEAVPLAIGSTEPRYACNGSFQLSAKRGEILQNLLTSCAGRLTYAGGQFVIWPAAWQGPAATIGGATLNVTTSQSLSGTISIGFTGSFVATNNYWSFLGNGGWNLDTLNNSYSGTWAKTTNALNVGSPPALQNGYVPNFSVQYLVDRQVDSGSGTITLNVYGGATLVLTYTDGSSATLAPTQASITYTSSGPPSDPAQTYVTNLANAASSDPSVYATITQALDNPIVINLSGWTMVSNTGGQSAVGFAAITLEQAAGPFQWKPKLAARDLYNGCKGTYVSPLNSWQASDFPPYAQDADHGYSNGPSIDQYDANLAADGGDRRWLDIQLPFTLSVATAQRIAKIELLRRRQQGMGTFAFNLAMYQFTTLDVVAFTLPVLGWTNKLLEITAHRFTVSKQNEGQENESMVLGTELDLQETSPSIYSWSTTEELTVEGYQQPSMNGTQTVSPPTGVTATNTTVSGTGVSTGQIQVTWTPPTDGFVTSGGSVVVQYSTDDTNWTALGTFDASTTSVVIPNVAAGQQYWVRVAFVNVAGVQSAWTVYGPITATGSSVSYGFADDETPAGALDGTNQTFTLAHTPNPPGSLQLIYDGVEQLQGVDYSLSGNTIAFLQAHPNDAYGEWIRAWYRY